MFVPPPFRWPTGKLFGLGLAIAVAAKWLSFPEPHHSLANSLALAVWIVAIVVAIDEEICRRIQERRLERGPDDEGGHEKRPPSSPREAS